MRIILGTIFLFLLCSNGAFAESPQKVKKDVSSHQDTRNIKYGTEQSPFIIKIADGYLKEKTDGDKNHWYDDLDKNRFLLCIGFLQLLVFSWQAICLGYTIKATKEAAKALPMIERAYVFANVKLGDVKLRENGQYIFHDPAFDTTKLSIMVKLTNQGKTPAILDSIYGGWVSQTNYPTKATVVDLIESKIPKGIVIPSGADPYIVNVFPHPVISGKDWKLIFANETKFFCYGRIEYKDVLGKDRKTGFCWEFVPDSKDPCFTISDSDLNEYK